MRYPIYVASGQNINIRSPSVMLERSQVFTSSSAAYNWMAERISVIENYYRTFHPEMNLEVITATSEDNSYGTAYITVLSGLKESINPIAQYRYERKLVDITALELLAEAAD